MIGVYLWHETENFRGATRSSALQGHKRRAERADSMPALDPELLLTHGRTRLRAIVVGVDVVVSSLGNSWTLRHRESGKAVSDEIGD